MNCIKCNSENVLITSEQNSHINLSTRFKFSSGLLLKIIFFPYYILKFIVKIILFPILIFLPKLKTKKSIGYTKVLNSTVAICQNCGNKWKVK